MDDSTSRMNSETDELLVAYLDGELDAASAQQIDKRLANESELRQRLQQHQRAWDMLDELPRSAVSDQFTQTTVEMVAISVADSVDETTKTEAVRSKFIWLLGAAVSLAAAIGGYSMVASVLAEPNRQLVEDLHIIENLDAYRATEDIDFLRALEAEGLFTVELDDDQ